MSEIKVTPEMVEAGKNAFWDWENGPEAWNLSLGIERIVAAALEAARHNANTPRTPPPAV